MATFYHIHIHLSIFMLLPIATVCALHGSRNVVTVNDIMPTLRLEGLFCLCVMSKIL